MMIGMKSRFWMLFATMALLGAAWGAFAQAPAAAGDGPQFTGTNELVRPANFREWIYVSSGIGMSYGPNTTAADRPQHFTNVYVNPSSYRSFMKTGRWPDKTIFVLEVRKSESEGSINKSGRYQTELAAVEAEVKDSRYPDGWAFFNFGPARSMKDVAEPLSGQAVAPCVECHTKHTAVERTFVQFYPTLLEAARQKGTLKAGF